MLLLVIADVDERVQEVVTIWPAGYALSGALDVTRLEPARKASKSKQKQDTQCHRSGLASSSKAHSQYQSSTPHVKRV